MEVGLGRGAEDKADPVGNRTLRDLWDDLGAQCGERTFLVFEDRAGVVVEYTYAQFNALITRSANLFRSLGVGRGDAVAVHLRNSPELLMCMFGLTAIGAVMVPLHPSSTRAECADIISRVGVLAVVFEADSLALYGAGGPGTDHIAVPHALLARSREPVPGTISFETARDAQPDRRTESLPLGSDDVAGIVFTSGTTARSKGVVLTHANLLFSGIFVQWQANLTSGDRLLTTMPACHVNFQLNALMPVLHTGATLIMLERYSARSFWRQVCHHEATVVQSIAMIVRTMLLQPPGDWEADNRVREVLYYLPITDEEKVRFEKRFATRILNSYGTSETLVGVITDPPVGERRWPSIGRIGRGYEARIADDDGREVPPGVVGEIQVRGVPGRTLMKEYFHDPAATAAAAAGDGWMHSGDLGYVDAEGWFTFVERRTHLIKRAGETISPAEVEAVLTDCPGVCEAAVIGVPDPIHDEAVKAFVVLAPGAALTAQDAQDYCRTRLAGFKVPTVVEIVPALPHTSSYKVEKSRLG
ncbi:crotonobetaine/carnitine-CoA ligase [Pengzhenrongella frigida]|uniref:Crotonobetaine/carnitine-CoA ligase n=1 Tax=Pengzhenrongella frigida TaxID=1259133 RepID=A0A4Q5MZY0_9MICO|nr:crotonobetaine/carnitine-CoA ligase [Cellulomonas sp. HLT2-17]RYV51310.1 crotonobetaine/carnitine-CoA ligase [Cellulomonas sp. HLT2-17]